MVEARWNPSEGGDRGGLETRLRLVRQDGASRDQLVVGLAEFMNKELRTGREMQMKSF